MKKAKVFAICGALSLTLAAAGMAGCSGETSVDGTATALVINGEEVNAGTANFILRYQQAQTAYMMESYGFTTSGSSLWGTVSDTSSYGYQFKDSIKDTITDLILLRQHASEYEVSLTDEELSQIDSVAQTVVDSNTDALAKIGATKDDVAEVLELYTYQAKMDEPMKADTDREVSDEEAAQTTITYTRIPLTTTDDSGNETVVSDEEKASLTADCEELISQVQATGDVANADISAIAEEINEDFFSSSYSYGSDDTAMPDSVHEAVDTLSDGELYDGVLEDTDTYLYVVRLDLAFDEEATETEKQSIISERETENYNNKLQEWKDAITVEEESAWTDLTVTDKDAYTVVQNTDSTDSSSTSGSSSTDSSTSGSSSADSSTSGSSGAGSSSSDSSGVSGSSDSASDSSSSSSSDDAAE